MTFFPISQIAAGHSPMIVSIWLHQFHDFNENLESKQWYPLHAPTLTGLSGASSLRRLDELIYSMRILYGVPKYVNHIIFYHKRCIHVTTAMLQSYHRRYGPKRFHPSPSAKKVKTYRLVKGESRFNGMGPWGRTTGTTRRFAMEPWWVAAPIASTNRLIPVNSSHFLNQNAEEMRIGDGRACQSPLSGSGIFTLWVDRGIVIKGENNPGYHLWWPLYLTIRRVYIWRCRSSSVHLFLFFCIHRSITLIYNKVIPHSFTKTINLFKTQTLPNQNQPNQQTSIYQNAVQHPRPYCCRYGLRRSCHWVSSSDFENLDRTSVLTISVGLSPSTLAQAPLVSPALLPPLVLPLDPLLEIPPASPPAPTHLVLPPLAVLPPQLPPPVSFPPHLEPAPQLLTLLVLLATSKFPLSEWLSLVPLLLYVFHPQSLTSISKLTHKLVHLNFFIEYRKASGSLTMASSILSII